MIGPTNATAVYAQIDPSIATNVGSATQPVFVSNGVIVPANTMVDTINNQTVGGIKTRTARTDYKLQATAPWKGPTSTYYLGNAIQVLDGAGDYVAQFYPAHDANGNNHLDLISRSWNDNAGTTAYRSILSVVASVTGNNYVTAPSRAYNAANTSDVATIGTLDAYSPMVRTSGNQERISGTLTSKYYGQKITSPIASAKWVKWLTFSGSYTIVEVFGTRTNNDLFYAMFSVAGYYGYNRSASILSAGPNNSNIRIVVALNTTTQKHEIWVNGGGNTTHLDSIQAGIKIGEIPTVINEEYDALPSEGYTSKIYMMGSA